MSRLYVMAVTYGVGFDEQKIRYGTGVEYFGLVKVTYQAILDFFIRYDGTLCLWIVRVFNTNRNIALHCWLHGNRM